MLTGSCCSAVDRWMMERFKQHTKTACDHHKDQSKWRLWSQRTLDGRQMWCRRFLEQNAWKPGRLNCFMEEKGIQNSVVSCQTLQNVHQVVGNTRTYTHSWLSLSQAKICTWNSESPLLYVCSCPHRVNETMGPTEHTQNRFIWIAPKHHWGLGEVQGYRGRQIRRKCPIQVFNHIQRCFKDTWQVKLQHSLSTNVSFDVLNCSIHNEQEDHLFILFFHQAVRVR